ncbi:MAG TPA: TIGR04222 domain-containing membrane protein [Thermoanaerobaculia bacterium]|nr:TIGR04222 domain-containing membrane protein [Thermoanaerobaculia bacterium]
MNPFDWRGPQFLVFFVVLAIVVLIVTRVLRRRREMEEQGYRGTPIHDPYAIAFLRGGKHELVRVGVVSLVDRGLLSVLGERVVTTEVGRSTRVRRRIEQELLTFCETPREATALFAPGVFDAVAGELEGELTGMGLLPDERTKAARWQLCRGAAAVLLFVSVTKIVVALSRGRTNIGLLILFTVAALLLLRPVVLLGRTARGDAFLEELKNLFRSLKLRAGQLRPGGATSEVAMLAAVWGVGALPAEGFGWRDHLFKKSAANSGSSCGSSCGSGCGGGCGGGGCGGCGG